MTHIATILDEDGEVVTARLWELPNGRQVAIKEGITILPGAFTVLSEAQVQHILTAEERAIR